MNTQLAKKNILSKGFSLVEMLVVIAVIGIIAAIAIPNIGSINSSAQTATAKRNAQNLASVYTTGSAAGVTWTNPTGDKAGAVAAVQAGASYNGQAFSVDGLDAAAVTGAMGYLNWGTSGPLKYAPSGTTDTP